MSGPAPHPPAGVTAVRCQDVVAGGPERSRVLVAGPQDLAEAGPERVGLAVLLEQGQAAHRHRMVARLRFEELDDRRRGEGHGVLFQREFEPVRPEQALEPVALVDRASVS